MKKIFVFIVLWLCLSLFWYPFSTYAQEEWWGWGSFRDDRPWWANDTNKGNTQPPEDIPQIPKDLWQTAWWEPCTSWDIMLNISIPFVGRCIKKDPAARQTSDDRNNTTSWNVFPKLMWWLIRLLMTIIYIIWFLWILVGWFMISASGADPELKTKWRSLIKMVIWWLILVGLSGIILNFINPDFFSTASDATP
jgi:hypothetical protein